MNKSFNNYHFSQFTIHFDFLNDVSRIIVEEKNYNLQKLNTKWQQKYFQTNVKQKKILNVIIFVVKFDTSNLFFIDDLKKIEKMYIENLLLI